MNFRTAESATEGQSDKLADQISDAVVDAIIANDPTASISCETLVSNGFCIVAGEIRTETYAPIAEIARSVFRDSGYTDGAYGFDYRSAGVITAVNEQSAELSAKREGGRTAANDSCAAIGFACAETPEFMPLEVVSAHKLTRQMARARKDGVLPFLLSDGKAQVSVAAEGGAARITHIVISAQHTRNCSLDELREGVMEEVVKVALPLDFTANARVQINPAGSFVIGGPQSDSGMTGRKVASDSYGMVAPSGGSLSGKDPLKIDRAGAYMARYLAKNIAAAGVTDRVMVSLAYEIGALEPVAIDVLLDFPSSDTARSRLSREITAFIAQNFDLSAGGIAKKLDLFKPLYRASSVYGTFGRKGFGWEETSDVEVFKRFL
ncbi:MAG: methionine adenosyltransferase [Helicobacteraceae bacterium]|jgi:S-adenosylmethionine synthetase|nr:methionine adenosyltransferase [Helicobacteraceae bacterium]